MEPLPAPPILEEGLAFFIAITEGQQGYPLIADLTFSEFKGQVQKLLAPCPDTTLASFEEEASQPYTLLLYKDYLQDGYYTLRVSCLTPTKTYKGEVTIGVLINEKYKVIGSPYSIYPPLELI
jgi:hypothetical protein